MQLIQFTPTFCYIAWKKMPVNADTAIAGHSWMGVGGHHGLCC